MEDMSNRRLDSRVEMGAVRLRVENLDRMLEFYRDVLGFQVTYHAGRAAVLSAGGFHPHIVLIPQDADGGAAVAPSRVSIRLPDRSALAEAFETLAEAAVAVDGTDDGVSEALHVRDPEGNHVELYYDRPRDAWPIGPDGLLTTQTGRADVASFESLRGALPSIGRVAPPSASATPLSETTRSRLADVRLRLLNLHKALLDDARSAYEMDRGRVGSNASLLQLVINDPWFAWLHRLSELVVRIDEALQAEALATESDGGALLEQVERLLSPGDAKEDFAQRYHEALQRQPAVIVAHAEVRRVLKQAR